MNRVNAPCRCAQALELTQMAKKGAHFRCPQHYCAVCRKSGDGVDMVKCIRCPTAYHSSCMPKDIQRLLPHAKVWPRHHLCIPCHHLHVPCYHLYVPCYHLHIPCHHLHISYHLHVPCYHLHIPCHHLPTPCHHLHVPCKYLHTPCHHLHIPCHHLQRFTLLVVEGQELSCTYLAHHELESVESVSLLLLLLLFSLLLSLLLSQLLLLQCQIQLLFAECCHL